MVITITIQANNGSEARALLAQVLGETSIHLIGHPGPAPEPVVTQAEREVLLQQPVDEKPKRGRKTKVEAPAEEAPQQNVVPGFLKNAVPAEDAPEASVATKDELKAYVMQLHQAEGDEILVKVRDVLVKNFDAKNIAALKEDDASAAYEKIKELV